MSGSCAWVQRRGRQISNFPFVVRPTKPHLDWPASLGAPCRRSSVLGLTSSAALASPGPWYTVVSRFTPYSLALTTAMTAASDVVANADCRFGRLACPNGTCDCNSTAGSGILVLARTSRSSPRQSVRDQKGSRLTTPPGVPTPLLAWPRDCRTDLTTARLRVVHGLSTRDELLAGSCALR